jgi:hypothetical protein
MLELRLPHVGKRLGHRSLARYYRQNLRPEKAVSQGEQTHRLMIEGPAGFTKGVVGVRKFGERSMMVEVSKRRKAEREARRFRDHRKKDEFRTEVAFRKTAEFKKYYRGISPIISELTVRSFAAVIFRFRVVDWDCMEFAFYQKCLGTFLLYVGKAYSRYNLGISHH